MTSEHGDARPWEVWFHEMAAAAATQTVFIFFCAKFARNVDASGWPCRHSMTGYIVDPPAPEPVVLPLC